MFNTIILVLLLFGGLYLPTSSNAVISNNLLMFNSVILGAALIVMLLNRKRISTLPFFFLFVINLILWFATLTTPFNEIKVGSSLSFFIFSLLCCMNFNKFKTPQGIQKIFLLVNVINIFIGFSIIFQSPNVTEFIRIHYSAYYQELVPNMLMAQKPILTFASHSIAGLFLYLFFYLNLKTYTVRSNYLYLLLSIIYVYFLFALKSNAGYLFMILALIQVLTHLFKNSKKVAYSISFIALILVITYSSEIAMFFKVTSIMVEQSFSSSSNGFLGRYSTEGNLAGNIQYLTEHPFRPIGFGYSTELFFGDSGLIEYLTRGSVLLVVGMYGALFTFLKINLIEKKSAYFIFMLVFLFELGFTILTYGRFLFFLPFVIIYLNYLQAEKFESDKTLIKQKVTDVL